MFLLQIAGKCSSPPKYADMDISNLPTSAMCTEEELRRQEEEEKRRKVDELRRKQEDMRRREEELRKTTTTPVTYTTITTTPQILTTYEISAIPETNSTTENIQEVVAEANQTNGNQTTQTEDIKDGNVEIGSTSNENDLGTSGDSAPENVDDSTEMEINTEDSDDNVEERGGDKDNTKQNKYPNEELNSIFNDGNYVEQSHESDKHINEVKSNIRMDSQKSRKSSWSRTPWVVVVIVIMCGLLVIGSAFAVIKARGYLYRDDYNFNFTREHIIDEDDESVLY